MKQSSEYSLVHCVTSNTNHDSPPDSATRLHTQQSQAVVTVPSYLHCPPSHVEMTAFDLYKTTTICRLISDPKQTPAQTLITRGDRMS